MRRVVSVRGQRAEARRQASMVTRASARLRKICSLGHSSRKRLLND
jgi:hypothetical protein